jgi:hypothetical protein
MARRGAFWIETLIVATTLLDADAFTGNCHVGSSGDR